MNILICFRFFIFESQSKHVVSYATKLNLTYFVQLFASYTVKLSLRITVYHIIHGYFKYMISYNQLN